MQLGADEALCLFGVRLVGFTPETGRKLLLSLLVVAVLTLIVRLSACCCCSRGGSTIRHGSPPGSGPLTAGLAVALQRVVTAFAAYFGILRAGMSRVATGS